MKIFKFRNRNKYEGEFKENKSELLNRQALKNIWILVIYFF